MKNYYSIEIKKTQKQLIEVLNNSQLPFSVKRLIVNNLLNIVDDYAEQEYEANMQAYNQELEELEKEKENNESSESEENK